MFIICTNFTTPFLKASNHTNKLKQSQAMYALNAHFRIRIKKSINDWKHYIYLSKTARCIISNVFCSTAYQGMWFARNTNIKNAYVLYLLYANFCTFCLLYREIKYFKIKVYLLWIKLSNITVIQKNEYFQQNRYQVEFSTRLTPKHNIWLLILHEQRKYPK